MAKTDSLCPTSSPGLQHSEGKELKVWGVTLSELGEAALAQSHIKAA